MKRLTPILPMALCALVACSSASEPSSVTWDESDPDQGQLSGDLGRPTPITLATGDNFIMGTSIPGAVEVCIDLPDGSQAPYYPEHETYIDVFSFTLPADQRLAKIVTVKLDVEPGHPSCGMPLDEQLGAFTGLVKSDQIDWNSDSFENFVRLPSEHPLIGAGFANIEGENLLSRYEAGLVFGPIEVGAMTDKLSDGTYTFWWKEGANKVSYVLNFVVEEI
jgi:hypothetical protein